MAIVFTQQTDFTYSVKSRSDFTPLPRVRRTHVDFSEQTLSICS